MKEVLKFLTDNAPFFIATVDGNKPKVRPFGFAMEYEGKLWFCTSNQKDVYKQLKANPYFEVSTAAPNGEWIRIKGKAVFNSTPAAKAKALEVMPSLTKIYSVDDPTFEVFYIEDGEAAFCTMIGEVKKTIKL